MNLDELRYQIDSLDSEIVRLLNERIRHCGFNLRFRNEVHRVLGTTVKFGMAFLPTETLHLSHRQSLNAGFPKGLPDVLQLERLNDCRN